MNDTLQTYSHMPSAYAIASGVAFGATRILSGLVIENRFLLVTAVTMPQSYLVTALLILFVGILAPLFEEAFFRKDLNNPTFGQVVKNSLGFGLLHGLIPGSIELRITRIFASTIGGFFYCGARIAGGDVWSSALAHSMYNLRWLTKLA